MPRFLFLLLTVLTAGCSSLRYEYHYVPGKTASLADGQASAPENAPSQVHAAIAAANRIAGSPYSYGGGHGSGEDTAFDCSGATSYVLRNAGLLRESMPSGSFRRYATSGEGNWITVWAHKGHVFLVIAGLRFDTGWHGRETGPAWTIQSRPAHGYSLRHPSGL